MLGWYQNAKSTHHPHKMDNQHRECKTGGGTYFAFFLGSDKLHTTPPPQKYHLMRKVFLWGRFPCSSRSPMVIVMNILFGRMVQYFAEALFSADLVSKIKPGGKHVYLNCPDKHAQFCSCWSFQKSQKGCNGQSTVGGPKWTTKMDDFGLCWSIEC